MPIEMQYTEEELKSKLKAETVVTRRRKSIRGSSKSSREQVTREKKQEKNGRKSRKVD